jgi:UDP:flavonoid glycosyltransferase YjiC (YdhE family)
MKFVVAGYGSRGDVEPCAAAALELLRRGHDVRMAVPPNMLGFVESAGLVRVAYGPDSREDRIASFLSITMPSSLIAWMNCSSLLSAGAGDARQSRRLRWPLLRW